MHVTTQPAGPSFLIVQPLQIDRDSRRAGLRNRNLPTRVLSAICRTLTPGSNEEARWLFVTHPNAMFSEVVAEMQKLTRAKLLQLSREPDVRQNVKMKAREMTGQVAVSR